MDVGARIKTLREQKQISTNKLANLAGISQSYLRDVEHGVKNPTVEIVSYICDALDISLQEFFTVDNKDLSPFLLSALKGLSKDKQNVLAEFLNNMNG